MASGVFYGVDISDNQEPINWTTLASAVTTNGFIFIKAAGNETGSNYTESDLGASQAQVRTRGIPHGYYYFTTSTAYAGRSGVTDANYFLSAVGTLTNGEMMILDFDGTASYTSAMDTYCYDFLNQIQTVLSMQIIPFIYGSESLMAHSGGWSNTASIARLWVADYTYAATDFSEIIPPWFAYSYSPNYQFLQYSSTGTGSAYGVGSKHIDLDSFYSANNSIADFVQWGYQGGGSGNLTYADVTQPAITFTQPLPQTIIVPKYNYDHVLFSKVWETSVTASSWPQTLTYGSTGSDQHATP